MKTVGKNCIVYSVKKSAGYRGCGEAFAIIDNEEVIKLTYVDELVDSLTDCDMGSENLDLLPSGITKVTHYAETHASEVKGMCSSGEFCV